MTADSHGPQRFRRLNLVILLDHRIGEQLFAHRLEVCFGTIGVAARQLQVDDLALAHLAHRVKAQAIQGMADGLALRVENTILEGNEDARFH